MNDFDRKIRDYLPGGLAADGITTLQINLGRKCNLACSHCHLDCAPGREEQMSSEVMEVLLSQTARIALQRIDITGGSPELHPRLPYLLERLFEQGHAVQVRTNLTILAEPGASRLIELLKAGSATLVGSLPCYLAENMDAQRGTGTHAASIAALRLLNRAGYGIDEGLTLNLAYNPTGFALPPRQSVLEEIYRKELANRCGLSFTHLLVLTNMPIGRFRRQLTAAGQLDVYMDTLRNSFNPATLPGLMCRRQISADWDGTLYDCDFNLALGMPVNDGSPASIASAGSPELVRRRVMTGSHCFGCTAGAGSSCSGALA